LRHFCIVLDVDVHFIVHKQLSHHSRDLSSILRKLVKILSIMTRTAHHPHPTPAFPVYCLDWADDDTLLLGGGGGASRSGIENKLVSALCSSKFSSSTTARPENMQGVERCSKGSIYQRAESQQRGGRTDDPCSGPGCEPFHYDPMSSANEGSRRTW